jgi:hypothetical protein
VILDGKDDGDRGCRDSQREHRFPSDLLLHAEKSMDPHITAGIATLRAMRETPTVRLKAARNENSTMPEANRATPPVALPSSKRDSRIEAGKCRLNSISTNASRGAHTTGWRNAWMICWRSEGCLAVDDLSACAVPADSSKSVAGTWIRFMTRLATEIGMALAFPKRCPSTETPIKGTAGPEIVSASSEAVIRSRRRR